MRRGAPGRPLSEHHGIEKFMGVQPEYEMTAGVRDITPEVPLPLAGYAGRTGDFSSITDNLELNGMLLSQGDCRIILMSADLLFIGRAAIDEILDRFGNRIIKKGSEHSK